MLYVKIVTFGCSAQPNKHQAHKGKKGICASPLVSNDKKEHRSQIRYIWRPWQDGECGMTNGKKYGLR